ncbi:TerD family protein [Clostridioides sp. ZZV15-6383]|uniref:TerD family protein n=1 Tax=Clostridioides sp. ZZV15-6383 TaxID=2811498 RepID=UPI001D0FF2F0|nr:TerD family protein [Clostridioides sp. ZZV15-6383]
MSVSLQKGQRVSLVKDNNPVKNLVVGLGWDINKLGKKNYDLDAFAIALTNQDKMNSRVDLVYFGNLKHPSKAIIHTGDNLTGRGEGDDEQIIVNLNDMPEYVHKIIFGVSIYKAKKRDQDFSQMNNSFIRLVDSNSDQELFKYNLQEDFSGKVTVLAGEIYRRNEEWKFNALGLGQNEELRELINTYK